MSKIGALPIELLTCKAGGDGWSRTNYALEQVGYSHLDVHTSHLQILARLEGLEPPSERVETGRSNPLSYKRMAESGVALHAASNPTPSGCWLGKSCAQRSCRPLTDSLSNKTQRFTGWALLQLGRLPTISRTYG